MEYQKGLQLIKGKKTTGNKFSTRKNKSNQISEVAINVSEL